MQTTILHGANVKNFGGDLLFEGRGMNQERYHEILETLPADVKKNAIGWRCVGNKGPAPVKCKAGEK